MISAVELKEVVQAGRQLNEVDGKAVDSSLSSLQEAGSGCMFMYAY